MPITRKPKKKKIDVDSLIKKGGSPPAKDTQNSQDGSTKMNVQLRIPRGLMDRIDKAVRQRTVPIPRHTWILEAIVEKLKKEWRKSRS